MIVGPALALALAAGAPSPAASREDYVGGLCAPFVLGDAGGAALEEELRRWGARPVGDAEADAARPTDVELSGQMFRLPDPGAPRVFLDRRRGSCGLVFPAASVPGSVSREFAGALPVGDHEALSPWRRVRNLRSAAPGPPRYFMKVGDREGFGLCGAVAEDLRLRDGRPATLVTIGICRLRSTEALDNG